MTNPITPDTVRALIADAGPEDWRAINGVDDPDPAWGSFPMVVTEPSGAPDDGGDEVAIVRNRSNGDAALMAASKRIALAYLAVVAERDRLARIIDNPGDYTVTFRKGEIPKDAHRYDSVSVAIPAADLRDHLRARLDADRAGGSDV